MKIDLSITRLGASTLFKIQFVGMFFFWGVMACLLTLPAVFGADTLQYGERHLHGLEALAAMLNFPVAITLFSALNVVAVWPGLWVYSKVRKFRISFYSDKTNEPRTGVIAE